MRQSKEITARDFFFIPIENIQQVAVILLVSILLIFFPQQPPIDWDLNTSGFWSDILNTYADPNRVYPPWGLILMIPYYLVQAEGARFFSGIVIGLLVIYRGWSLSRFLAIVISPYTFVTLAKSNMDILVLVLPILVWEIAAGKRWQNIGWGLALSTSLLKPQAMIFIWLYWFWSCRKQWKELMGPMIVVAIVVIPISLVGAPPLIIQWLNNLRNPSLDNVFFWSINNVSLSKEFSFTVAVPVLLLIGVILIFLVRLRRTVWTKDHTISCLLFSSMFLSPYTSQQSVSSALAFVPSWGAVIIQFIGLAIGLAGVGYREHIPLYVVFFAFVSLILFTPAKASGERQLSNT